jgi:TonB-linked SusC/RagA family outer membrane protein
MRKKTWQTPAHLNKLFFLFSLLLFSIAAFAQTITGTIRDADGKPIANASVQVKGTTRTTLTDNAGKFSINAAGNDVLVISIVGFNTQEVRVSNQQSLNVSMTIDNRNMENVVVTALNRRQQARSLGYSATTANVEDLQKNRTNNVMASLEGKIAGLDITPPSAGPASSTKIRIRGQSGFNGTDNAPLLVINGLPMGQGANSANGGGGADGGSRDGGDNFLMVNPDDIESMTVLKGATAAALYGARASNGAIIITTKSGARNTGIGVEITSGVNVDEVLDLTDFQMEYGQGDNFTAATPLLGKRPTTVGQAINSGQFGWGERYDGAPTIQFDGVMRPYSPNKNRIKDFYNTGMTYTNSVAFSNGGPKGSVRVSFSDMRAHGITPANEYKRKILNLGLNQNLSDKLSVTVNVNYTNDENKNAPQGGVQGQNYYNYLIRMSPVIPLSAIQEHAVNAVGAEQPTNSFATTVLNPYFYIPREFFIDRGDRILSTATVKYQFFKWLYLQGRVNANFSFTSNEWNNPTGGGGFGTANQQLYTDNTLQYYNGSYNASQNQNRDMNFDFILGGNHKFGDFSMDLGFSGNRRNTIGRGINANSSAFVTRDVYTIGNGSQFGQGQGYSKTQTNSLFGWAEFGWKNFLYLNLTGRNDWFSLLNEGYDSYFYPSVSGSFVFSEFLKDNFTWLSYGKLRASWAQSGQLNGVGYASYDNTYSYSTNKYLNRTIGNANISTANPKLTPYGLTEKEIGLELKMFRSRVNVDMAVYHKKTTDQIINVSTDPASGQNTVNQNLATLQNKGFEFLLDVNPFRTRNFSWNSALNAAYNISKVLDLAGATRITRVDWYNGGASNEFIGKQVYEVGKPLAQIAARTYKRNDKGEILLSKSGQLIDNGVDVLFGSALPTWTTGWNNSFNYKKLNLLVQVDGKFGGKMISGTALNGLRQGHSKASLVGRREGENGVIFPGVFEPDATNPNAGLLNGSTPAATKAVFGRIFYTDYRGKQIADPFVFKSDYIKLRNITLSYDFSSLIGSNVKFVKGVLLSASCRNVAIIKKYVPDIDPEQIASSGDDRAGYEAVALPTTRTWGVNLNVKF